MDLSKFSIDITKEASTIKNVTVDLGNISYFELVPFADEHIGDPNCSMKSLDNRIKYVANNPYAYGFINGDICDNATITSIGDSYAQVFTPDQQVDRMVELFSPIKNKILTVTPGNHEGRTYKREGIDIMGRACKEMGIYEKYSPTSICLFINQKVYGRNTVFIIYINHGSGGGRKEGAKASRLAEMASIINADVYVHSHTHLPMIMKEGFIEVDKRHHKTFLTSKLFVNTGANLLYGGYGVTGEFKPGVLDTPLIKFEVNSNGKFVKAEL